MGNFELKSYLFGAETPVKLLENGNYNTDIELPEIPEGDVAYFITVNVAIKSNNDFIPDFNKILRIVSLNSMTGFEVDAQRINAINDYIAKINE